VQASLYVFRLQQGSDYGKDATFEFVRLASGKTGDAGRISFDVSSLLYSDSYYLELREADGVLIKPRDPDAPYLMPTGQAPLFAQMDDMQPLDLKSGLVVYVNQYTIKPLIEPLSGANPPRRASDYNLAKYWIYFPVANSGLASSYTPTPSVTSGMGTSSVPTQIQGSGVALVVSTYQPNHSPVPVPAVSPSATVSVSSSDAALTATVEARRAGLNSTAFAITVQAEATQNQLNTPVPSPTLECRACVPPATATLWAKLTQTAFVSGTSVSDRATQTAFVSGTSVSDRATQTASGVNQVVVGSVSSTPTSISDQNQNGTTSQVTGSSMVTSVSFSPISGSVGSTEGQSSVGTRSPSSGFNQAGLVGSIKSGSVSSSGTPVTTISGTPVPDNRGSASSNSEAPSFMLWIILSLVLVGVAVALFFFWRFRSRSK